MNINASYFSDYSLFFFKDSVLSSLTALQKKILVSASIAFGILAAIYVIYRYRIKTVEDNFDVLNGQETNVNQLVVNNFKNDNVRTPNIEYIFLAKQAGRGQKGACGSVSIETADKVRQKLQEKAAPGIFFDSAIYHENQINIGTCTVTSLELASTYFRIKRELAGFDPSSEVFLNKLRLVGPFFEESSEEMRSRQIAFSSIVVDRTLNIDVSKNKVESCVKYHDFEIDYVSKEIDITIDANLLQEEINILPYGVYFIRMLRPSDNHKLEVLGHSMIYINEENVKFFYDNNCGLEKMPLTNTEMNNGIMLYERLLNVHNLWGVPMTRFYRLKLEDKTS